MAELSDLIGLEFEDESGKEFEITEAGAHPNFESGVRIVARVPDFEEIDRPLADHSKAVDARDAQAKFASDEWETLDDAGLF